MSWIDTIRQKPQAVKLRIIWTIVAIVAVLLILVWVLAAKYHKQTGRDTTLFDTIGQGLHDVKNNYHK